jgi:DNA-binding transcriptional ArsR family regulator
MSKNGHTKNEILNIISSENKTMSEISESLNLAPSTVSQHLKELKELGAIEEIENPHIKKWKYYKLNPKFNYSAYNYNVKNEVIENKIPRTFYYLFALLATIVIAYIAISYSGAYSKIPQSKMANIPLMLTDPPNVPNGTSSLYIRYSSLSVQTSENNSIQWINSNTSGNINLMSLINTSKIIGNIKLEKNSTVNILRFNITSANITINNVTYPVILPNNQLIAHLTSENKIINSSSGILIDLSPSIITIYKNNSSIFEMIPSMKAITIGNPFKFSKAGNEINNSFILRQSDIAILKNIKSQLNATNIKIFPENNSLYFTITLKNNGNSTILLNNIYLIGNETLKINPNNNCNSSLNCSWISRWHKTITPENNNLTAIINENSQSNTTSMNQNIKNHIIMSEGGLVNNVYISHNFTEIEISENDNNTNINFNSKFNKIIIVMPNRKIPQNLLNLFNNSKIYTKVENDSLEINMSSINKIILPESVNKYQKGGMRFFNALNSYRTLNFIITQNGTLVLFNHFDGLMGNFPINQITNIPISNQSQKGVYTHNKLQNLPSEFNNNFGYTLKPGQSVTFTYQSALQVMNNANAFVVNNSNYKIVIISNDSNYFSTDAISK